MDAKFVMSIKARASAWRGWQQLSGLFSWEKETTTTTTTRIRMAGIIAELSSHEGGKKKIGPVVPQAPALISSPLISACVCCWLDSTNTPPTCISLLGTEQVKCKKNRWKYKNYPFCGFQSNISSSPFEPGSIFSQHFSWRTESLPAIESLTVITSFLRHFSTRALYNGTSSLAGADYSAFILVPSNCQIVAPLYALYLEERIHDFWFAYLFLLFFGRSIFLVFPLEGLMLQHLPIGGLFFLSVIFR